MNPIQSQTRRRQRGYSIMEIVVTAAIIGILVLILTPVVAERSKQAKIRSAEADVEHIANALERAAIDTGYLYRIYVLDDSGGGDGLPNNAPLGRSTPTVEAPDRIDGIQDEDINTDLPLAPLPASAEQFMIDTSTQNFLSVAGSLSVVSRITNNETSFGWRGPYINWHRDANNNDWPDDPWGNDYYLFTRNGGIGPTDKRFEVQNAPGDGRGVGGWDIPAVYETKFDRPTIVSWGPDGFPGDVNVGSLEPGTGDDIRRSF